MFVTYRIDTDAIRKAHRRPEFGDWDTNPGFCHDCGGRWPCVANVLCDEVDRLRARLVPDGWKVERVWAIDPDRESHWINNPVLVPLDPGEDDQWDLTEGDEP